MGGLRSVHITHCIKLLNNAEALSVLPPNVTIVKEKKKKDKAAENHKEEEAAAAADGGAKKGK